MRDPKLDELLRELPRTPASPAFRGRVLASVAAGPNQPARRWTTVAAAAAAALALVLAPVAWRAQERASEQRVARERVEAMQREYDALANELRDLRKQLVASEPVVTVEGDDGSEYLIDLSELAGLADANAQPASYRPHP